MCGVRQSIASGVQLFFGGEQWKGAYWDKKCGNGTDVLMMMVPVATHIPMQAQIAEQHSLAVGVGGASQYWRKRGPCAQASCILFPELPGRSHSSLNH